MNKHDRLTELLLGQCMAEFDRAKGTNGRWPERAVFILKDRFHHKFFGLGKPARAWVYDGVCLDEINVSEAEDYLNTESNRIYYRVARFSFAFPEDMSTARLSASLGPKSGSIYRYDVLCADGIISLGKRRLEGMS